MLINLEEAGDLGTRQDDVLLLGKCDDVIKELAKELGWLKELKVAWAETRASLDNPTSTEEESEEEPQEEVHEAEETEEERLQREIAWLTKSVGDSLRVTDDLKVRVEREVKGDAAKTAHLSSQKETKELEVENSPKGGSNL